MFESTSHNRDDINDTGNRPARQRPSDNWPTDNQPRFKQVVGLPNADSPDLKTDVTSHFVQAGEVRLHVRSRGLAGNTPMLLLHGTALTSASFDKVAAEFARDCHVVTPDIRGHGDSDWHPRSEYRHSDFVSDIDTVRAAVGWDTPMMLLGHSISGLHSLRYAAERPENVSSIVLVDVLPTIQSFVVKHLFDFVAREFDTLEDAVRTVKGFSPDRDEADIAAALNVVMTYDEQREVFRYKSDPALVKAFYELDAGQFWSDLNRVNCPVLLVLGADSLIVPPEAVEQFQQELPDSKVVSIPAARHTVMADNPAGFAGAVRKFIKELQ